MSKICQITGKKVRIGNKVSHANNKMKRRFNINLLKKRFFLPKENRWILLKISAAGIRTVNTIGIEEALKRSRKKRLIK